MEEIRRDHVGCKRGIILLEHDGYYIVADMTFTFELLRVVLAIREQSGYVEHYLSILIGVIHRMLASLAVHCVEAAAEAGVILELYAFAKQSQEFVERFAMLLV